MSDIVPAHSHVAHDFETASELDVRKVGAHKYFEHPSTRIVSLTYAINDGPEQLWTPDDPAMPDDLSWAVRGLATMEGHSVQFERLAWETRMGPVYGWPVPKPDAWRCTLAACAVKNLPVSLDKAGAALGIENQKDATAQTKAANRRVFTGKGSLVDLMTTYEYNMQDVRAERGISKAVGPLTPQELRVFQLDAKINNRGIAADAQFIDAAIAVIEQTNANFTRELIDTTDGAVQSGNEVAKMLDFLATRGVEPGALKAELVTETLKHIQDPVAKRVLELRQLLSRNSTKKLYKARGAICNDGRLRGLLQYAGATQTLRWAGRLLQPQNFKRPTGIFAKTHPYELAEDIKRGDAAFLELVYGDANEAVACALRQMFVAPPGKALVVRDFAAIECRVLNIMAGQENVVKLFREKGDPYIAMAQAIYKKPINKKDHPIERQIGKETVLGAGYQMGGEKYQATVKTKTGMDLPLEFCKEVIKTYRAESPAVTGMWSAVGVAAIRAVRDKGKAFATHGVEYKMEGRWLSCRLPSGGKIYYTDPELREGETPWGEPTTVLSYMAFKDGQWRRVDTYGGKLVENIVQAVARELLVNGMFKAEDELGYPIVLTVHDEVIAEVDEWLADDVALGQAMEDVPHWARGWPIATEGWVGERFRK